MENIDKLKLVVIAALILAGVAAFLYLAYGLTIIWQGMAAGVTVGFLLILLFIVTILAIYLWIRIFLLRRELKKCQAKVEELEHKLKSETAGKRLEE
jgi:membrane protein implicated in regulation of membrane protease activity